MKKYRVDFIKFGWKRNIRIRSIYMKFDNKESASIWARNEIAADCTLSEAFPKIIRTL